MSAQGQLLEITVVGCSNLKDTEWISRQDPYVILEYANSRHRSKTDTDGGRNPKFNEKWMLPLIEGLQEVNVAVWNRNTFSPDDFIGSGKIQLNKVLTEGYHDSTWPLTTRSGKRAGEVRIILHYGGARGKQNATPSGAAHHAPPTYPAQTTYPPAYSSPQPSGYPSLYTPYPPVEPCPYHSYSAYQPPAYAYPYPPQHGYPPSSHAPQSYPPLNYPPQGYNAPPPSAPYPPYQGGSWTR